MKVLKAVQQDGVSDAVRAKFAMVVPILEATLFSLSIERATRLGGYENLTLEDLAIEFAQGDGDAGICFEYAVHEAIATGNPIIEPIASDVLERLCNIPGGAASILFGPEKEGRIPILESVQQSLTDDSRLYVGNRGHPPKLKKYVPQIIRASRRKEDRNKLPRSITGIWKADLFLGNVSLDKWVGTTVKINGSALDGAQGLRVGIYPQKDAQDVPRKDDALNLIRLPLPYDAAFMELFYSSFHLTRAFMRARGKVHAEIHLPLSEDRYVTKQLSIRKGFPAMAVLDVIRDMSQIGLLVSTPVENLEVSATLSEESGLVVTPSTTAGSDAVSVSPSARIAE